MFATIASLILVWWLYQSAVTAGANPWKAVAVGLVSFYVTMQIWSGVLIKAFIGRSQVNQHSIIYALTIEISSIIVGLIVVELIRRRFLSK